MKGKTPHDPAVHPTAVVASRPSVPMVFDADVVVVGAGPGGFAAALQAARQGASVIVVERYDMPGGVHTSGLQGAADLGVGGIHSELMARFAAHGCIYTATEQTHPGWAGNPLSHYERRLAPGSDFRRMTFNPEGAGSVMAAMLEEAGVMALYGSSFVDTEVEPGRGRDRTLRAVIIENATGRHRITGRVFVDGSGTAELVARAGVPFVRGGGPQPKNAGWDGVERPVPGGLLWTMQGVDLAALVRYQRTAGDRILAKAIAEATAAGDLPLGLYRPPMDGGDVYGGFYIGHPTLDMSPIADNGNFVLWQNVPYEWSLRMDEDERDHAHAHHVLSGFIDAEAHFLKKYVPGFEHATITRIGRFVGVRDGRHPVGEHIFCLEDASAQRHFPDAVTKPMTKTFYWNGHRKYTFEVPYRCFLPKGIDNMLLTGASLSFTYETIFMVMRNFPWCTQTGEIAGHAAAIAVKQRISPKAVEWSAPYF